jgi:hypothetical protein
MAMQQLSPSCLDRIVRRFGDFLSCVGEREPDPVEEATTKATEAALAVASLRKSLVEDKVDTLRFANVVTGGLAVAVGFVASKVSGLAAAVGVLACVHAGQIARQHIHKIYERKMEQLSRLGG